jgi:hypothetical protein
VNKQLRSSQRSNPHTLSFASEDNRAFVAFHLGLFRAFVCSSSPSVSTVAKIAQFGRRMGKI